MARLTTDVAVWAQARCRRKIATEFLAQLQFDSKVDTAAHRRYRTHQLAALRLQGSEILQPSSQIGDNFMQQWRQSVARAFHFALVAARNMGAPRILCRRTNRELAATKIAKTFRAHCCTLRVRSRLLHTKLSMRAAEAVEREQAVILTQQFARGWLARHNGERRQRSLYAIAIEKFVRGNRGRSIARHVRARQAAAVRLQASMRARAIARALGPRRAYRRLLNGPTTAVQSCARRIAAMRVAAELRAVATVNDEDAIKAKARLMRCRRITRAELCAESHRGSAKYRGEFQAVFAQYCRGASESETSESVVIILYSKGTPQIEAISPVGTHPASEVVTSKQRQHRQPPDIVSRPITCATSSSAGRQRHCAGAKMTSSEFVRLFKETPGATIGGEKASNRLAR